MSPNHKKITMKKTAVFLFASFLICVLCQAQEADVVFKNVSIVSMKDNSVLKNTSIAVKDGKIIAIGASIKLKTKKLVEGNGKFLMPSISDAHVHFPATEEEFQNVLKLNLINGVTKLRSMRGDWKHVDWKAKYNTKESWYPKLYLSAPPITRALDWNAAEIEDFVSKSKNQGFDLIKILSIKSLSMFQELDRVCKINKMAIGGHYPSFGSINASDEQFIFDSNYSSFEHLGGLAGESQDVINRRVSLLKTKNKVVCPTLSWYNVGSGRYTIEELRKMPGMEYVAAAQVQEWLEATKNYRDKLGKVAYEEEVAKELMALEAKYKIVKQLHDEGVSMILSPDASSKYMIAGFSVLSEMELLKNAQLSNFEILKMTTVNFADFFNENYGTIEVGKNADFILLDGNPLESFSALKNVHGVYFNQQFLSTDMLNEMKQSLLKSVGK